SGGSTVGQYTPSNLGGVTPVQGGENLQGGGSAAGQIVKERAKSLPGAVNNPTGNAAPTGEGN
ncbi:hypothetical protein, partial [Salmonella enterica]|uniref:hypothetical protein n=1 Tax=Salmonella enterica TaxID=28901 RepID=UPI003D26D2F3